MDSGQNTHICSIVHVKIHRVSSLFIRLYTVYLKMSIYERYLVRSYYRMYLPYIASCSFLSL